MNTKRRLSDDLSNDSEILSEKRFVKLYKEELESIEKQIHDLKKIDQKWLLQANLKKAGASRHI